MSADFLDRYRGQFCPPSYREIVDSWGYEVVAWETFGEYQGDHGAILRRDGQIGYIIIGYGSCSGCDVLEDIWSSSCSNEDEIQTMLNQARNFFIGLKHSIRWSESLDDLIRHLRQGRANGTEWALHDDEILTWLTVNFERME